MKRHFLRISAALLLASVGSFIAVGCGGSGGGSDSGVRDTNGFVTRAEEDQYSTDALVLASREAPEVSIPTATAVTINNDLVLIRTRYPILANLKARPQDDLKSVLVLARTGSPVATAWAQKNTTTGVADLDALLTQYKVDTVAPLSPGATNSAFVVRFINPINTQKVRETLQAKVAPETSGLVAVQTNGVIGDGNQITRTSTQTGRVYEFSRGWGDCQSGCINRHKWTVTINNSGALSLEETGTPLTAAVTP